MKRGPTITGIPERGRSLKTASVQIRLSEEDKDLIREAAGRADEDSATFAQKAALARAREVTGRKGGEPAEIKS